MRTREETSKPNDLQHKPVSDLELRRMGTGDFYTIAYISLTIKPILRACLFFYSNRYIYIHGSRKKSPQFLGGFFPFCRFLGGFFPFAIFFTKSAKTEKIPPKFGGIFSVSILIGKYYVQQTGGIFS